MMGRLDCEAYPLLKGRRLAAYGCGWRPIKLVVFELMLAVMAGLLIMPKGKATVPYPLAQQTDTCTESDLENSIALWRRPYSPAAVTLRDCGDSAVPYLIEVMTDETVELKIRQ